MNPRHDQDKLTLQLHPRSRSRVHASLPTGIATPPLSELHPSAESPSSSTRYLLLVIRNKVQLTQVRSTERLQNDQTGYATEAT